MAGVELPGGRIRLTITLTYTVAYMFVVWLLVSRVDDLSQTQATLAGMLVGAMAAPLKDCYGWWFASNGHTPPPDAPGRTLTEKDL